MRILYHLTIDGDIDIINAISDEITDEGIYELIRASFSTWCCPPEYQDRKWELRRAPTAEDDEDAIFISYNDDGEWTEIPEEGDGCFIVRPIEYID